MAKMTVLSPFPWARYNIDMSIPAHSRLSAVLGSASLAVLFGLLAVPAQAQTFTGYSPLPFFAWPKYEPLDASPFEGSYARMSAGYQVTSSKGFGTLSGPTIGLEGGKMWREGRFVYGVVGALDYMPVIGGYPTPGIGSGYYSRDFAGGFQLKAGFLAANNVLVYTKLGATAFNETLHFGATNFTAPFNRNAFTVRPDARVGVEWAVSDKVTIGIEAGVTGSPIR